MALPRGRIGLAERGQALLEYAALVAAIGICIVASLGLVGRVTQNAYVQTANSVAHQTGSAPSYGGAAIGSIRVIPAGNRPPPPPDSASSDPDSSAGSTRRQ